MTDIAVSNPPSVAAAPRIPDKGQRCCAECGVTYTARREASRFCAPACRTVFLNRRNMRGAILYDLKMAERFEREDASAAGALSIMNRLCADWRDEDNRRRQGRKSWGDWKSWLLDRPYLSAERLVKNWAGRAALKKPRQ